MKDNRGARFPVAEGRGRRGGRPWSVASLARPMRSETVERCLTSEAKGKETASARNGERERLGANPLPTLSLDTWDLYALSHISHISRMSPIRYQGPAPEDSPACCNTLIAHSPFAGAHLRRRRGRSDWRILGRWRRRGFSLFL